MDYLNTQYRIALGSLHSDIRNAIIIYYREIEIHNKSYRNCICC